MYRQGDVLLVPRKRLPPGSERRAPASDTIEVARGEATGHTHALSTSGTALWVFAPFNEADDDAERYIRVRKGRTAWLRHEEHAPIGIPAGLYQIVIQRQYSPMEIFNVDD